MSVDFRPLNKALVAIFNYQTVTQENMSPGFANNEGTDQTAHPRSRDQTAHPRSLISDFAIRYLETIVAKLVSCKISLF